MGHVTHHAIVVTSWSTQSIADAREKAVEIGLTVTDIAPSRMNGYASFLVAPDGSKEGWAESDTGDLYRFEFKDWLRSQRFDDRSSYLEWVEVQYGSDDYGRGDKPHVHDDEWNDRP